MCVETDSGHHYTAVDKTSLFATGSINNASDAFFSDDVKKLGFTVIIDMRGSTWHNVKPILRVLQVL